MPPLGLEPSPHVWKILEPPLDSVVPVRPWMYFESSGMSSLNKICSITFAVNDECLQLVIFPHFYLWIHILNGEHVINFSIFNSDHKTMSLHLVKII